MSERWLTTDEAIGAIQAHVAGSPGFASSLLKKARASGEVRHRNDMLVLAADDGVIQTVHGINADGKPVIHHINPIRRADFDEFNEDDLMDWLIRKHGSRRTDRPAKQHAGAPEQYDWDDMEQFIRREFDKRGDFSKAENRVKGWRSQNDLIEIITDYLEHRNEPAPGPTRFKEKVGEILAKIRNELAAGH